MNSHLPGTVFDTVPPLMMAQLQVKPSLSQTDSGYIIDLTYEAGRGMDGYSLCYLSVTLPTDKAPRLRLHRGEETLGVMSTVTQADIPAPTALP